MRVKARNAGMKPSNTAAQNSTAWDAFMQAIPEGQGANITFEQGTYDFERQMDVIRQVQIEGIAGAPYMPTTIFRFPAGSHGIYLHSYFTLNQEASEDRADGARVKSIRVQAIGKTTIKHGVVVKAPVMLEDVCARLFAGDGFNVQANLPEASTSLSILRNCNGSDNGRTLTVQSTAMDGNDIIINFAADHSLANDDIVWLYRGQVETDTGPMEREVTVEDSNSIRIVNWALYEAAPWTEWNPTTVRTGCGFFFSGGDANAITVDSCRAYTNHAWGDYDDSFLGNIHIGELTDGNEIGAYYSIKSTARNIWLGCYSELSNPQSNIAWPSEVHGGDQGAHIYGDFVGSESGLYNPMQIPTMDVDGTVRHKVFIGDIADADAALIRIRTSNGDDFRVRYDYGNAEFDTWDKLVSFWNYANVTGAAYGLTTSSTVWSNGRVVENGNIGKIVWTFGFYMNKGSRWDEGTAAPGSGAWMAGDRRWNSAPAVGQPEYWVCTVSGTPGTWVAGPNL